MKKIWLTLSVAGLALSSLTTSHAVVNIPVTSSGFSFSLTGLYLQPNANNLGYAVYTHPLPLTTPNWSQVTLKPGYSTGFDVGAQYNFADSFNKVNADFFYINTKDTDSFAASGANSSVAPPYYFGPLAQALVGSDANSQAKFNISDFTLTFGRLLNLTESIQIDPFAGIDAAYLKQDITSTYLGVDALANPYAITSYNTSKFTGIGPRAGVNLTYFFTNRLGFTATFGGALLAGSMSSDTNFNSYGDGNTTPAATTLASQSQNMLVPKVDSKLEINYKIPTNECGSGVTFAAGYLFTAYINGINQVVPTALVPGAFDSGAIAVETTGQTQSDIDLNGPYLTVVWKY